MFSDEEVLEQHFGEWLRFTEAIPCATRWTVNSTAIPVLFSEFTSWPF